MNRIPYGREVDQAMAKVGKEINVALKQLNQHAGTLLSKGCYDKVEELLNTGRLIHEFRNKVKVLQSDWRELRKGSKEEGQEKGEVTPLWEYYRPILQSLVSLGGRARRKDLEQEFEAKHLDILKPGDLAVLSKGIPRWKKMIRRARKPMIQENYIEDNKGLYWQVATQGRRIAKSESI
jgi:hypothetical protein